MCFVSSPLLGHEDVFGLWERKVGRKEILFGKRTAVIESDLTKIKRLLQASTPRPDEGGAGKICLAPLRRGGKGKREAPAFTPSVTVSA